MDTSDNSELDSKLSKIRNDLVVYSKSKPNRKPKTTSKTSIADRVSEKPYVARIKSTRFSQKPPIPRKIPLPPKVPQLKLSLVPREDRITEIRDDIDPTIFPQNSEPTSHQDSHSDYAPLLTSNKVRIVEKKDTDDPPIISNDITARLVSRIRF